MYFTVKNNKVENLCSNSFSIDGEETLETEGKVEIGYTYIEGVLSPPTQEQ